MLPHVAFVNICALTGVQYVSEALVAIQRLKQLLDLPNRHGFNSSSEADEVVLNLLKLYNSLRFWRNFGLLAL